MGLTILADARQAALVRLADMTGVDVPLHKAAILLFSSLYGRDFMAENDILPEISEAFSALPSLARAAANGWLAIG